MRTRKQTPVLWFLMTVVPFASAQSYTVEKKTVRFDSLDDYITCELFDPDFAYGDNAYTGSIAASDGKIYFFIGSHNTDYASRFFCFDPAIKKVKFIAKMDTILGVNEKKQYPQGKVHARIFEHKNKLWFATHTAFYQKDETGANYVAGQDYKGKIPYMGAHFMNYNLKTGKFTDLAKTLPNEGIISMAMDKKREVLYGITWPSAPLHSYDIKNDDLRCWGSVQGRGGWGRKPHNWQMICRTLTLDADGFLYGSTMDGRIWKYDPNKVIRVSYIDGLDLKRVPFAHSAEENRKGTFRHTWRTIEWNPKTKSFWGLHFETSTLFEFVPEHNYIRAVTNLGHEAYHDMPRNPEISQLGFTIGPKNTIFYLAHGPAVKFDKRIDMQSSLYLITYQIDTGTFTDHGPILSADKRRVFFSESIAIAQDGHMYTTAWVEITDPERAERFIKIRKEGSPEETQHIPYEIMLVRLPKWQNFLP